MRLAAMELFYGKRIKKVSQIYICHEDNLILKVGFPFGSEC